MTQPSVVRIIHNVSATRTDPLVKRDGRDWHEWQDIQRARVCMWRESHSLRRNAPPRQLAMSCEN